MARGDKVGTVGRKYIVTKPEYGLYDAAEVEAGIKTGEFVLMERTVVERSGRNLVERPDRRYFPKRMIEEKMGRGWKVIETIVAPLPEAPKIKPKKVAE